MNFRAVSELIASFINIKSISRTLDHFLLSFGNKIYSSSQETIFRNDRQIISRHRIDFILSSLVLPVGACVVILSSVCGLYFAVELRYFDLVSSVFE